jgi:hypothetical protein
VFAQQLLAARKAEGRQASDAPLERLTQLGTRWRKLYNFGEFQVTPWPTPESEQGARVQIIGYPDMSACHGHTIMGWSQQLVEDAGATDVALRIEERPWMHNSLLTYTLTWA